MKPPFLDKIEEAFASNRQVILSFNVADRYIWQEEKIGPSYLSFFLGTYFGNIGYRVAEYSPATGLIELNPKKQKNKSQENLFHNLAGNQDLTIVLNRIITVMRKKGEKCIIIIHYGEHLAPRESTGVSVSSLPGQVKSMELLHKISLDDDISRGRSRLVLITYSESLSELITKANGYQHIRIEPPVFEERYSFVKFLLDLSQKQPDRFGVVEKDINAKELSTITAGMPLISIESLFRLAAYKKDPISRQQLRKAKAYAITQLAQDLLEVTEPSISFKEVAGMKPVVEFFQRQIKQIRANHAGVAQTTLLQGLPGSGKTHLAQVVAHELGWPLVQLRSVRGPYVGQSEQQLERVITIVEQLKPVVLLIDEIDQSINQRGTGPSGDSGTSERMLARFFNWLGGMEHRGRILFIGTTNRPDILDAALLDRFRVSIPILNPTEKDLVEFILLLLNRFGRKLKGDSSIEDVAKILAPINPSGRSLQEILIHAGLFADNESGQTGCPIGSNHLIMASEDYIPIEDPIEMEFIRLTSLSMCSANSFLPWMSINGLRPDAEIPEDLISEGIVDKNTGRLNKTKLHQKLRDLGQTRQYARAWR